MPTVADIMTINAQLNSLIQEDCAVSFDMEQSPKKPDPIVKIVKDGKEYHFSDPDYQVVIAQIAHLWKTIRNKNE